MLQAIKHKFSAIMAISGLLASLLLGLASTAPAAALPGPGTLVATDVNDTTLTAVTLQLGDTTTVFVKRSPVPFTALVDTATASSETDTVASVTDSSTAMPAAFALETSTTFTVTAIKVGTTNITFSNAGDTPTVLPVYVVSNPPTISYVSNPRAPITTNETTTYIFGTNFSNAVEVYIGGVKQTLTSHTALVIGFKADTATAGWQDLVVTNPGIGTETVTAGFEFYDPASDTQTLSSLLIADTTTSTSFEFLAATLPGFSTAVTAMGGNPLTSTIALTFPSAMYSKPLQFRVSANSTSAEAAQGLVVLAMSAYDSNTLVESFANPLKIQLPALWESVTAGAQMPAYTSSGTAYLTLTALSDTITASASLSSGQTEGYYFESSTSMVILTKHFSGFGLRTPVYASGVTVASRAYNGSTSISVNLSGATLTDTHSGVVLLDTTTAATGTLSSADVGTRTVTITGLALTGSQASTYVIGDTTTTVVISKATQSAVTLAPGNGTVGTAVTLSASGGDSGSYTYAVTTSGTANCSLSGASLSATSAGTCTVTATRDGGTNYNSLASSAATYTWSAPAAAPSPPTAPTASTAPQATTTAPQTVAAAAGAAAELTISIPGLSSWTSTPITVTMPAGATAVAVTLAMTPVSTSAQTATGLIVIQVKATATTGGTAVTTFSVPLQLKLPTGPSGAVTVWSADGVTWTAIPAMTSTTLAATAQDGYYANGDGTITIHTRHLSQFGYRLNQAALTATVADAVLQLQKTTAISTAGGSGSGSLTYRSTTPTICSVSATGVVTGLSVSTCTIEVTKASSDTYLARSTTVSLAVSDSEAKAAAQAQALAEAEKNAVAAAAAASAAAIAEKSTVTAKRVTSTLWNIAVDLADKYAGKQVTIQLGTKVSGKLRYRTIATPKVGAKAAATFKYKGKAAKGNTIRVLVGKTVIAYRTI